MICPECGCDTFRSGGVTGRRGEEQDVFECVRCLWRAYDGEPEYDAIAESHTARASHPPATDPTPPPVERKS